MGDSTAIPDPDGRKDSMMSTNQDSPESQTGIPPRFQFGLGTLFWVTTVTAIAFSLLFRVPAVVAIPVMLFISAALLPAMWTTVIIYGRGYQRTFSIGAMFPAGILMLLALLAILDHGMSFSRWDSPNEDEFWVRLVLFGFWASSLLVGGACMGLRWLVERRPACRKP